MEVPKGGRMSELIFAAWNRGWYLNLTPPVLRG